MSEKNDKGFIIPTILSFMIALSIITGAVVLMIDSNFSLVNRNIQSQQAFNIAEAGINYYLWHLSHNATDYKDGKTTPTTPDPTLGYGPYVHNYVDSDAKTHGTYTLWINPQGGGSTVVRVRSIGKVTGTNVIRTIEAQIGAPSFASYGLVADTSIWFGNTESANGPIHSNIGIRMDGPSNSDVTSANATYVPPGSFGGDGDPHPGVWCSTAVLTPVNCNTRSKTDWRYPVPSVDFNQVSGTLCTIKKQAFQADSSTTALANLSNACAQVPTTRTGAYLPQRATNGSYSLTRGYLIQLNNNNTYDLYQVNGEDDRLTPYTSALTLVSIANGIAVPSGGVIFAEDNVWVRTSTTFNSRVTIAAGRLATTSSANIVVADDLVYTDKNGTDAIGLIAEDSVLIAPYAPPATGNFTFEVDAAMIAQSGTVTYPGFYRTDTDFCTRGWVGAGQLFSFYGSVATRNSWTWTWQWNLTPACGHNVTSGTKRYSGILNNTTQYDYNLQYAPPPSFPITSSYNILSWREVLVTP